MPVEHGMAACARNQPQRSKALGGDHCGSETSLSQIENETFSQDKDVSAVSRNMDGEKEFC